MGKERKDSWTLLLRGSLLALGMYLLGILLLALLMVKGTLPDEIAFPIIAVLCCVAVLCGGLTVVRRAPMGTLPAGLVVAAVFGFVLVLVSLGCWQTVAWTGRGGVLLLCALAGGVLAGVLGGRKRRKRKKRLS